MENEKSVYEQFTTQMRDELKKIEVILTDRQMQQFYDYYVLMIEWNTMVNLTSITRMNEVVTKHFVDSLALVKTIADIGEKSYKIIDVGTGAGFPGIPLKIAFPQLTVVLLDSLNKRVKFLDESINRLELTDITAIHGRAEDLGHQDVSRETFDLCVSRAVANIATLAEYCMPFVKTGGFFVSYKAGKIEEEIKAGKSAIKKLGGEIAEILTFTLPNADERSFVKIRKIKKISKSYPRKAGMPSKEPLH